MRRTRRTALLAASAALLAACGGGDDPEGGALRYADERGSMELRADGSARIETADGVVVEGPAGALPEGWPEAVPVPDEHRVVSSSGGTTGDRTQYVVHVEVDDADVALRTFEAALSGAGFEVTPPATGEVGGEEVSGLTFSGPGWRGSVLVRRGAVPLVADVSVASA